jgi:RNA polymerase sigma-70 factor (ECF subfamily)
VGRDFIPPVSSPVDYFCSGWNKSGSPLVYCYMRTAGAFIIRCVRNDSSWLSAQGPANIGVSEKDNEENRRFLDCSLVRAAQCGNDAAFEQLVHTHDKAVLGLAWRLTGSESDAQDIHQEAFMKAYSKLGGFRFECAFSTWIYRIVTNVCLDHLRKKRSLTQNRVVEIDVDEVPDDSAVNNPEQQLLRKELSAHISRALQRLTPRERMIFELKHFQGMQLRMVSEILKSPEGSVKTSFYRATQKLRCQLAKYTKKTSLQRRCDQGAKERVERLRMPARPPSPVSPENLSVDERGCL